MALTPGTRLGPFEVLVQIGVGGMGEVYKATDTNLKRAVAIKVLPASVAGDAERLARFQREAEVLAALNHPNIAAIYGLERSGATNALVMELVEGPTLADRITQGAIRLDEALPIAKQIAEALEAAHEQGIIHRDLKPANVKVRPDGVVKVLDFGLAKLAAGGGPPAAGSVPLSMAPTISSPAMLTGAGMLLGTAAYMSPEQAKGHEADKRSDIWAFGCVLYEMLTGRRTFSGEDVADTLANVLKIEPDWNGLSVTTPPAIHRLLYRCLAKDRKARLPDIGVARLEIDEANHGGAIDDVERVRPRRGRREWLAWTGVALCLLAGVVIFGGRVFESVPASLGVVRFQVDAPEGGYIGGGAGYDQLAVSPDGRRIAFRSGSSGTALSLYVRVLDSTQMQRLRDTDRGSYPFWSPDSRHLGFAADGKLKTIDVASGTVQTLCDASAFLGGTWNGDGVILFSADGVLRQVPVAGGKPVAVTRLDTARGDQFHRSPQFLPDGRHFLFTAVNRDIEDSTLHVGDTSTNETEIVDRLDSIVQYASSGYLLFARRGALMARPFDPSRRLWTGEAISVADTVRQGTTGAAGAASFSVSAGGVLAYDAGSTFAEAQLTWVSRGGQATGTLGPRGRFHTFWLAPDENRVVVERAAPGDSTASNLWLLDGERSTATVFTPGTLARHPAWSPDGRWIVYSRTNLIIKEATGLKEGEPLLTTPGNKLAVDWSPDGKAVVFQEQNPETGWDLGLVPLTGSGTPTQLLHTRSTEQLGQLSPNGRFMAYVSNETGRDEVYVVNVPEVTKKWPISNAGGGKPRSRRDGNELFFVDTAGMLMSVSIGGTQEIEAGVPKPLFELRATPSDGWNYAVSADGQRFLVLRSPDNATATPITIVLNWSEELKRLVPTR